MGMYSYVRCSFPLPDDSDGGDGRGLQSKDFRCDCGTIYEITVEGRLKEEIWHYEDVPKEDRPHPDAPKGSLLSAVGMIRKVHEGWLDLEYHGKFTFYDGDIVYVAKFTDGECEEITSMSWNTYWGRD